jgi:hypothetical protein
MGINNARSSILLSLYNYCRANKRKEPQQKSQKAKASQANLSTKNPAYRQAGVN